MMKEFTLKVSEPELHLIAQAIHEMPYRAIAALINKIQGQVNEQNVAAHEKQGGFEKPIEPGTV